MTLYEKIHNASKEELATMMTTLYGVVISCNNEFFKSDPMLGFMSFVMSGTPKGMREQFLEDLDKNPAECFLFKEFRNRSPILDQLDIRQNEEEEDA